MNNLFQIFLCDAEHLNYNLTERAEVFEASENHFKEHYYNYNYKLYMNEELSQEIYEFDKELHNVYDNIIPYAYKADLGRYFLLYKYGGWYFDLNAKPNFYIEPKKDILMWENKNNPNSSYLIENRIIYSQSNKKFFLNCLQSIIKNYNENNYGKNPLFITGPGLIKIHYEQLNEQEKNQFELHKFNYETSEFLYEEKVFNKHKHQIDVIETLGLNYLKLKGVNVYDDLYEKRNVYRHFIPKKIERKIISDTNSIIPRIIHQTFKTNVVDGDMMQSIKTWIDLNPEYEYKFYDDDDIRNYVKNFDCTDFDFNNDDLLQAFDSIIPGAGRADIFRYCVIYQEGGVYSDIDTECVMSLSKFVPDDADCLLMINTWYKKAKHHAFSQWFLVYAPKNKIIKDTLNLSIQNIKTRNPTFSFGPDTGLLEKYTGPAVLNHVIFNHFGFKKDRQDYLSKLPEKTLFKNKNIKSYFLFYDNEINGNLQKPSMDVEYVRFKSKNYRNSLRNMNMDYWVFQKVFK